MPVEPRARSVRRRARAGVARHWEDWGRVDPFWAVLTDRSREGNRWDPEAFFESGRATVDALWSVARSRGVPSRRAEALDVGCGPGRLSRALAERVAHVVALDVSSSMLEHARTLNRDWGNIEFVRHDGPDLSQWGTATFDVVCCLLVLQHLATSEEIETYLSELVRVLAHGGALFLQLTTAVPAVVARPSVRARIRARTRLGTALRAAGVSPVALSSFLGWRPEMRMTAIAPARADACIAAAGGAVLWTSEVDEGAGQRSTFYVVTRR